MPANVESMAYHGGKPWHGLGTQVPHRVTAKEMIKAAGLDWQVQLRPARGSRKINKKGDVSRYEIVRLPRPNSQEEEALFGVVSRRYQPLQNSEAFAFFDPVIDSKRAHFETAGALGEGERIWVLAKIPGTMEIVPGDECHKYLLLSNTHTGEGSVVVKFTSIRVVCENTLMLSMEDGQHAYRVRHSKMMQFRLDELSNFLAVVTQVYERAEAELRRLAEVQVTDARLREYFDAVFPRTRKQKADNKDPVRWGHVRELFDSSTDLQLNGVKGTLWAAYNAITRFEDYKRPMEDEIQDRRLGRIWFGSGADVKLRALQKASTFAESWRN